MTGEIVMRSGATSMQLDRAGQMVMLRSVVINVSGAPAPQGSKSIGRNGNVYESSKFVGPWRAAVKAAALLAVRTPFAGPVHVSLLFRLERPKGHYRTGRYAHLLRDDAPQYPDGYPDLDKLCRSTLDGLTAGRAWGDDSQAVRITAVKTYAERSQHVQQKTGCTVTITECAPAGADAQLAARADARATEQEPPCSLPF